MRRTSPRGVLHSFNCSALLTLLLLLLCLPCFASAHLRMPRWLPSANPDAPTNRLSPRQELGSPDLEIPLEHVVLADCTQGPERHLSSQMAYFNSTPDADPVDVAPVFVSQEGRFALWYNSKTNATFSDSGVWFQASLGRLVQEGEFAGYGQNGFDRVWKNFTCWKRYKKSLYNWDNADCSMVYDCDHSKPPADAPDSMVISSTPTNPPTGSTQSSIPSETAPTEDSSNSSPASTGLSHGALIGTIVGAVGALVVGGLVGIWFLLRRRSKRKDKPAELDQPEERHEADDGKGHGFGDKDKDGQHELDARLHVVEMDTEPDRYEMDGHQVAELDATEIERDIKEVDDIKQQDITDITEHDIKADAADAMDEPKTRVRDELKVRAIDKAEIRASKNPAKPGDQKEKEEQGEPEAEVSLRRPPLRTYTQTTWTTESDVDLAGFPIVLMSPVSPLSPSEADPKPPDRWT